VSKEWTAAKKLAYDRLREALAAIDQEDYEEAKDAILDVADQLTGWCSKKVAL
jgi:hypothetical protein